MANDTTRITRLETAFAREHDYAFTEGDKPTATHGIHDPTLESARTRYFATVSDMTSATGQYVNELVYCLETMQLYRCKTLPSTWTAVGPGAGIIEEGSNSNGEYRKFGNGTMICWCTSVYTRAISAGGTSFTLTLPAEFSSVVALSGGANPSDSWVGFGVAACAASWSPPINSIILRVQSTEAQNISGLFFLAIGEYK